MEGQRRVKALNRMQTPWSSLGTQLRTSSKQPDLPSRNNDAHPSPKRQKTSHDETTSRYFQQHPSVDLTLGSPVEKSEAIDLVSNSSTGRAATSVTGQAEFRSAENKISFKPRRVRRRDRSHGSKQRETTSPDVLAANSSPPPANIRSDLPSPPSKRRMVESTQQPPIKRQKKKISDMCDPISDDELSRLSHKSDDTTKGALPTQANKRHTNFTRVSDPRGNIVRTEFHAGKRQVNASPEEAEWIVVTRAVSGKYTYDRNEDEEKTLCLWRHETGATAGLTEGGRPTESPWLDIVWAKVQSVYHNATKSRIIAVSRSVVEAAPSQLVLELANAEDATKLVDWLSNSQPKWHQVSDPKLEAMFGTAWQRAVESKSHTVPRQTPNEATAGKLSARPTRKLASKPSSEETRDPWHPSPSGLKLKDKMRGSGDVEPPRPVHKAEPSLSFARGQGMETRSRRKLPQPPFFKEPSPDRWTSVNPNWTSEWHSSLVFPATGKNRTTVDMDDITRLDDGEFLNDNLINFYFRYLQAQYEVERPEVLENVYFFSTFFFEKLKGARGKINYDGVKAWTAKVDLLSYKYIVVPVNENAHWYLAIIYNAPRMLLDNQQQENSKDSKNTEIIDAEALDSGSSPRVAAVEREISFISLEDQPSKPTTRSEATRDTAPSSPASLDLIDAPTTSAKSRNRRSMGGFHKADPDAPKIVTLDSLGSPHSPTCKILKEYLMHEAQERKGTKLECLPGGMTPRAIPLQGNYYDCGVFILGYIEEFLKDPDAAMQKLLQREDVGWDINAEDIRHKVRSLLFNLQKDQQARLNQEREAKRKRVEERKARKEVASAARGPATKPKQFLADPHRDASSNGIRTSVELGDAHNSASQRPHLPKSSPARSQSSPPGPYAASQFIHPLEDSNDASRAPTLKKHTTSTFQPIPEAISKTRQLSIDLTSPGERNACIAVGESGKLVTLLPLSPDEPSPSRGARNGADGLLPSIESDVSSKGPQYDGIDTSIELTF